jgi:hypothetical protein
MIGDNPHGEKRWRVTFSRDFVTTVSAESGEAAIEAVETGEYDDCYQSEQYCCEAKESDDDDGDDGE